MKVIAQFEEHLTSIKKHMEEAPDHYMANPIMPDQVIDELIQYKDQVVWAVSSEELMKIIYKTIDLTASIPIDMK